MEYTLSAEYLSVVVKHIYHRFAVYRNLLDETCLIVLLDV